MPGWHAKTQPLVDAGELNVVGIVQEQHPERARLFMQWKQMDWPVMVDSLDLLDVDVVPITLLVDEHGVIRGRPRRAQGLERFIAKDFDGPGPVQSARRPTFKTLAAAAEIDPARARDLGDACFLWGADSELTKAIEAYEQAGARDDQGRTAFRTGVALRRRYEFEHRGDDFARAVEQWTAALEANTNQYIWRRRIQQYGPRLDKPYPFYSWVPSARAGIVARGETPVSLTVALTSSEALDPRVSEGLESSPSPDPDGKITRDVRGLITAEWAVAPAKLWLSRNLASRSRKQEKSVRVHINLRPNSELEAHWNNEGQPLTAWFDVPAGLSLDRQFVSIPNVGPATSTELRHLELEVTASGATPGKHVLTGYVLYSVCEAVGGTCRYLRQELLVPIEVAP